MSTNKLTTIQKLVNALTNPRTKEGRVLELANKVCEEDGNRNGWLLLDLAKTTPNATKEELMTAYLNMQLTEQTPKEELKTQATLQDQTHDQGDPSPKETDVTKTIDSVLHPTAQKIAEELDRMYREGTDWEAGLLDIRNRIRKSRESKREQETQEKVNQERLNRAKEWLGKIGLGYEEADPFIKYLIVDKHGQKTTVFFTKEGWSQDNEKCRMTINQLFHYLSSTSFQERGLVVEMADKKTYFTYWWDR